MSKIGSSYKHFIPQVRLHPEFPAANKHNLVKTVEDLEKALSNPSGYIAWDTETSSLSQEEGEIVGFSFAFAGNEGWYVPVNHVGCKYNLGHKALELFYERLKQAKKTFVYNMRFDFRFMEWAGFDMSVVPYLDVSVLVFNADSNVKMPSLKWAEKHFLGWEPDTFEETLGENMSFQYLDPAEGYQYACADAEGTFALAGALSTVYKECPLSCKLDNDILYPLMKFEDKPVLIDVPALRKMAEEETKEIARLEREIIDEVGYEFKIASNKQLGEALTTLGINTGHYTKGGQMKVSLPILEMFKSKYPVVAKLIEYSKKVKAVSSYMNSLADQASERDGKLRFAYITNNVPTGRLSSGGDKKNSYFAHLNTQCVVGSTRVFSDDGWKEIRCIKVGESVWDGDSFKKVLGKFDNGVKQVYRVTLNNGLSLTCTSEHQFYTDAGFRRLSEISVGDVVAVNSREIGVGLEPEKRVLSKTHRGRGLQPKPFILNQGLEEFWEIIGYWVGDGTFCNKLGINMYFNPAEVECYERIKADLVKCEIPFKEYNSNRGFPQLRVNSSLFRDWLVEVGFESGARNKRIPDIVFSLSRKLKVAFIRGLMAADGSALSNKNAWFLTTVSGKLAFEFQLLLSSVGVQSTRRQRRIEWCVTLNGPRVILNEQIGVLDSKKVQDILDKRTWNQSRYSLLSDRLFEKAKQFGLSLRTTGDVIGKTDDYDLNRFWVKVLSVESVGEEQVYDIHVEESNRYVANGILVHNSIPKPHAKIWFVHDYHEGDVVPEGDVRILDWIFSVNRPSDWIIEGKDPKSNIRGCFVAPENSYWLSLDYSAQELRVTANLANEKLWLDTMLSGGDLHKAMAIQMWGQENYSKDYRKKAKIANFGLIYLMKPFSMVDKFNEPLDVCEDIYNRFWASIPNIKDFQTKLIRRARRTGVVYNYLGRPRRVKYWFNTGIGKDIGFGCRTVVNTVVQSMGGDILKISILKLWKELYNNPKYRDAGVRFVSTIHDEINSYVPKDMIREVAELKKKCMTRHFPNWRLPIETGVEIGVSFGLTFPFKWTNDERVFVPDMEPAKKG